MGSARANAKGLERFEAARPHRAGRWAGCSARNSAESRAFSLPELLVVLGVLAVLIGLLLPVLASAQQKSRIAEDMLLVRNYNTLQTLAAEDNGGRTVLPSVGGSDGVTRVSHAMYRGALGLVERGYADSLRALDPRGVAEGGGHVRFGTSGALTAPPSVFRADLQYSFADAEAEGVVLARVAAPSALGAAFQFDDGQAGHLVWCCTGQDLWIRRASAMVDGSVMHRAPREFLWPLPAIGQNSVGVPMWSTLDGVRGRDRLRAGS